MYMFSKWSLKEINDKSRCKLRIQMPKSMTETQGNCVTSDVRQPANVWLSRGFISKISTKGVQPKPFWLKRPLLSLAIDQTKHISLFTSKVLNPHCFPVFYTSVLWPRRFLSASHRLWDQFSSQKCPLHPKLMSQHCRFLFFCRPRWPSPRFRRPKCNSIESLYL